MNAVVSRDYEGASFVINKQTKRSVFFEGPLASLATRFLNDAEFAVPEVFLSQFR